MSKKNLFFKISISIIVFSIIVVINYNNRSLEKLNDGYSEITITKIRQDQNIFAGRIFYPKNAESYSGFINNLDIMEFNNNLNYLISDANLYENFVSQLILELNKSYKIYKIDRRPAFSKIFISGEKSKLKSKSELVLENYKKNLYTKLNSRVFLSTKKLTDLKNLSVISDIQINEKHNRPYFFIFSSIFLFVLSFFMISELTKFIRNK